MLPVYQIIKGESDPLKALKMGFNDICAATGNPTVQTAQTVAAAVPDPRAQAASQVVSATKGVCALVQTPAPKPPIPAAGVKLSILKLPALPPKPAYPAGSIAWRGPIGVYHIAVPRAAAGLSGLGITEWNWYQINTYDSPYLATTDGGLGAAPFVEVATAPSLPAGVMEVTEKDGTALTTPWYRKTWFYLTLGAVALGGGVLAYRMLRH
jgi:hypothetical protein